jgi:hypothetical protein
MQILETFHLSHTGAEFPWKKGEKKKRAPFPRADVLKHGAVKRSISMSAIQDF